ncbi:MAG: class I SAM-dependent methyltransferase, partial [bacterium]|nr:class I SAM-dependent methyltransferase [bacterium]
YEEGKKIGFRDAVAAVWVILRFWPSSDIYTESGPEILEAFTNAPRFNRWMADTIRPFLGERVLEIGAGIGNLSRHLAPRRKAYIASDIDTEHLARIRSRLQHRPNLEVRLCDLSKPEDFEALAESLNSVVCLNVVEHIEDDLAALRHLHSALRPGGRAVVLVPQGQGIYGTLDEALGHFRRYSKDELQRKMEQCGFRVDRVLEFNRISRPGWYITGKILRKRTISPAQLWLFDHLVWLWRRLDKHLPWNPTSIIAIGVKGEGPAT